MFRLAEVPSGRGPSGANTVCAEFAKRPRFPATPPSAGSSVSHPPPARSTARPPPRAAEQCQHPRVDAKCVQSVGPSLSHQSVCPSLVSGPDLKTPRLGATLEPVDVPRWFTPMDPMPAAAQGVHYSRKKWPPKLHALRRKAPAACCWSNTPFRAVRPISGGP